MVKAVKAEIKKERGVKGVKKELLDPKGSPKVKVAIPKLLPG